jgi:hypothetical protein
VRRLVHRISPVALFFAVLVHPLAVARAQGDSPQSIAGITGHYEIRLGGDVKVIVYMTFWSRDGKLFIRQQGNPEIVELVPSGEGPLRFEGKDTDGRLYTFEFTKAEAGEVTRCTLGAGGAQFEAVKTGEISEDSLRPDGEPETRADKLYPMEELRDDFAQLRRAFEYMHPGLYDFAGEAEFNRLCEGQSDLIDRSMTVQEFYRIAAPVVAAVGCGHCRLMTPDGYWDAAPAKLFPLALKFFADKAYVYQTRESAADIPSGAQIASINGRPISEITDALTSIIPADGFNESSRKYRLENGFSFLYALWFGFPEKFTVSYIPPGGVKSRESVIDGIDSRELAKRVSEVKRGTTQPPQGNLGFDVLGGDNAALITIRSFSYYNDRETFYAFVDSVFATINEESIDNVILDLRGNDGGDPFCTTHLLSYLASKPVPYYAEVYPDYEKFAEPIPLAEKRFDGRDPVKEFALEMASGKKS